jgi:hypothetical protein
MHQKTRQQLIRSTVQSKQSDGRSKRPESYLTQLLRPLGLRIATAVTKEEPRKVLVYESFRVVCIRSIIYLVPAAVLCFS